jgi:GDP-4-dehydro-6-deoxy-D-mannose reductase
VSGGPVLVTGASGFAGSHLLEHLAGNADVVAWSRSTPPAAVATLATWQQVDLLDRDRVRAAIHDLRPARVFHCAGFPHVAGVPGESAQPLAHNVLATHHLFEGLRRAGGMACRVLVTGSATVYAASSQPIDEDGVVAPTSAYAVSKLAQEQLALLAGRDAGIDVIVTRSFNHTGPRQSPAFVAPSVARQVALIERGAIEPVIKVGNLTAHRDLSDVRDVVAAYAALMDRGTPGTIYNVASGTARSIESVVHALVARAKRPVRLETDPSRLRSHDTSVLVGDATRLRDATAWKPRIPFDQTLDDLLSYWRQSLDA